MSEQIRTFDTGANRNSDAGKIHFEGFLNPWVLKIYGEYMEKHRFLENGELRAPDNWQKGLPMDVVIDSGFRHFHDWWMHHRGYESREGIKDALCGLLFNVQSYLLSVLEAEEQERLDTEYAIESTKPYETQSPYQNATSNIQAASTVEQEVAEAYPELVKAPTILQSIPWLKSLVGKG